jgi:hypothetical protein
MNFQEFEERAQENTPPIGLSPYLLALWHDKRGDWNTAHETVQDIEDATAAWIHAYLHRKEGDTSNARYWYRRAGREFPGHQTLDQEWQQIAQSLL